MTVLAELGSKLEKNIRSFVSTLLEIALIRAVCAWLAWCPLRSGHRQHRPMFPMTPRQLRSTLLLAWVDPCRLSLWTMVFRNLCEIVTRCALKMYRGYSESLISLWSD